MSGPAPDDAWWREAVVYQVYPRSFADANGDGVGDLRGVTSRVGYLADLGVDAVWLSPFYPSGWADGGYDVVDYRDVDPSIGTLADFDDLVAALHERGIRLIVDIVPNHSSILHPWFQEALAAGPGSPARQRYIFRDGAGEDGSLPPNDWPSHFGASAWTRVEDGQWYLHLFAPQQADFNWDCADVRADFEATLRFWADRGVDGFRIDVAHGLAKDMSEPYREIDRIDPKHTPVDGTHPLFDRDELAEVYQGWSRILRSYDPPRMTVAEAAVAPQRVHRYTTVSELDQAFNFDFLTLAWDADAYRSAICRELEFASAARTSSTWVLGNHDCVRPASRLAIPADLPVDDWLLAGGPMTPAQRAQGLRRARAAAVLLLALPGSCYVYQGEELGLFEVADLPPEVLQDPIWERTGHGQKGRDGCRVPLPWRPDGESFGFGGRALLPQPAWFGPLSVEAQRGDPDGTLALYRQVLALRRRLLPQPGVRWLAAPAGALAFARGRWVVVANFGDTPVPLPPGELLRASSPCRDGFLPPDSTAWLWSAVDSEHSS
jgi:alpha-glucosidase